MEHVNLTNGCLNGYALPEESLSDNVEIEADLLQPEEQIFDDINEVGFDEAPTNVSEESGLEITFSPPLYLQRYEKVLEFLLEERWVHAISRVVDFGCAECKLVMRLKRLPYVREIVGVDVDEHLLEDCTRRTEPLFIDYIEPRPYTPIDFYLMFGSVADQDPRLVDVDVVTAIELIEHLDEETLGKFPETIFGFIHPKIVIITTPNQEFNVRFQSFEGPFRHWDHRFEWTRKEFQDWSLRILETYPDYKVEFFGIGSEPEDDRDTGHCSQGAFFIRLDFEIQANTGELLEQVDNPERAFVSSYQNNDARTLPQNSAESLPQNIASSFLYKIIVHHSLPFRRDDRPFEEKVLCETNYLINSMARSSEEWLELKPFKCRLDFLLQFSNLSKYDVTVEQLSQILLDNSFELEDEAEDDGQVFKVVVLPYASDGQPDSDEEEDRESPIPFVSQDYYPEGQEEELWD